MAAPTESYVDPAIAADSGAGTVGDPWGDLQFGLDQVTRDATDGDRFNIKAGTDEILSAALSLTTYGTPTEGAPLIFQGYTSAAEDGGIGGISGNGSVGVFGGDVLDFLYFKDLHLHNTGATSIISLDNSIYFENVEFDNSTGLAGLNVDAGCRIINCYFHNLTRGVNVTTSSWISDCYFENGSTKFIDAISTGDGCNVRNNIVNLSGSANTSNGIRASKNGQYINNTVWCDAGTGMGIYSIANSSSFLNNIVEGFSGSGGIGIELTDEVNLYGFNAAFNNATNYSVTGAVFFDLGDNEVLGASPFADPAGDDFTVDTSVQGTAYPSTFKGASTVQSLDKGAAQSVAAAGGGGGRAYPRGAL